MLEEIHLTLYKTPWMFPFSINISKTPKRNRCQKPKFNQQTFLHFFVTLFYVAFCVCGKWTRIKNSAPNLQKFSFLWVCSNWRILRIDLIWFIFITLWNECLSRILKLDEMAHFKILNIKLKSDMDRDSSADSIRWLKIPE